LVLIVVFEGILLLLFFFLFLGLLVLLLFLQLLNLVLISFLFLFLFLLFTAPFSFLFFGGLKVLCTSLVAFLLNWLLLSLVQWRLDRDSLGPLHSIYRRQTCIEFHNSFVERQ
jgi:hypothetical protein